MLTPSQKLVDSPYQTPSPIRRKRISRICVNKENYAVFEPQKSKYDLIPDEDATKQFIWAKKERRDRKRKRGPSDLERKRDLVEEHRLELEQLKKRKLERERLYVQRMKEKEDIKTLRLAGEYENWQKEEHAFMLRQAKERTKIRLNAGRPQPVDLLVQYKGDARLTAFSDYPLNLMARLGMQELGDLVEDVKVYKEIEAETGCVYWDDVLHVAQKYLQECDNDWSHRRDGINKAVSCDVNKILSGKSSNQLTVLQAQIKEKLALGNTDVAFWESLLENLTFYLSYARLKEMQELTYKKTIERSQHKNLTALTVAGNMKSENVLHSEGSDTKEISGMVSRNIHSGVQDLNISCSHDLKVTTYNTNMTGVSHSQTFANSVTKHYICGDIDIFEEAYSPKYLKDFELDRDIIITDPAEDMKRLALARQEVREMYCRNQDSGQTHDSCDSDNESSFTKEYKLLHQSYSWDSRYCPRKPRYFNRVITGFVWNRYNRTHYDVDNLPPKTVKGYKFNIFYPDLIDKSITPVYSITPCNEQEGVDIIRFRAGPPYEDIAFQIVCREWNKSVKRGYRCSFNGRVLELWFHFKHMCYRR